jgi:(p)ppGpp synthase/HD superfamily hydrolase
MYIGDHNQLAALFTHVMILFFATLLAACAIEIHKMTDHHWSQEQYLHTYLYAAKAHQGQLIPGSVLPYIIHPGLVCMEIIAALRVESGHHEALAVQCALLHDAIEDTPVTYAQLTSTFGEAVADGVQALSKDPTLPKDQRMDDSLRRIRLQPVEIWMVKLADRITNLQPPPPHWNHEKIACYREEARQILDILGSASPFLADRLADKIENYCPSHQIPGT